MQLKMKLNYGYYILNLCFKFFQDLKGLMNEGTWWKLGSYLLLILFDDGGYCTNLLC
jgi:hypothetical protein